MEMMGVSKTALEHALFDGKRLSSVVDSLRRVLSQPQLDGHVDVIDGLLALHADPSEPMPPRLAEFADDCGFYRAVYLTQGLPSLLASPDTKASVVLEINLWLLQHAEAAGFLPAPEPGESRDMHCRN